MTARFAMVFYAVIVSVAIAIAAGGNPEFSRARSGPYVTVSGVNDSTTRKTTLTVEITGLGQDEKFRDLHLEAGRKRKFPRLVAAGIGTVTVTSASGGSQTWNSAFTGNRAYLHIYAGTSLAAPPGFSNGKYTIELAWEEQTYTQGYRSTPWTVTNDGESELPDDQDLVIATDEGNGTPPLPQTLIALNGERPAVPAIGTTTSLGGIVAQEFAGWSYQIYTSEVLVPDYDDVLGIGIDAVSRPVPPAWGIGFGNSQGTLTADGEIAPAFTVTVPANTDLIGKSFYAVLAVKDGSGAILYGSEPIRLTIE